MQIHLNLLPLLLLLFANFFCSDSRFDSYTNLGTNIINDNDSLLTVFDGKVCKDTLVISGASSFIDLSDSIISGLNKLPSLAIGSWQNEHSYAFFKFNADSLLGWIDTINNNKYEFLSFTFNFINQPAKSDLTENVCIEIGYCNKKTDSTMLDTTKLKDISHYTFNPSDSSKHSIIIKPKYIMVSDTLLDTSSIRYTSGYIHTIEIGLIPVDTLLDTIKSMHPLGKHTVVIDTLIIDIPYKDTSYIIGVINFIMGTIQNTTIYPRDTIIYDSLTTIASLIKNGQAIQCSTTNTVSIEDTTTMWDSVITTTDTTTVYDINTTIIHIVSGQDTVDIYQYDTVNILTNIVQDTIIQISEISPRISLILHASDPNQWDFETTNDLITVKKNICLYARLDSIYTPSLMFFTNVNLTLQYLKTNENDTITKVLNPSYSDFSVFETNSSALDTILRSSGAAGRYTCMEIDLQPILNKIIDSSGIVIFKNIPKAELTIYPDSVVLHKSSSDAVYARYSLSDTYYKNIEDIRTYRLSPLISETTDSINIHVDIFLIDILYASGSLPPKVYLYLWMSPIYFAHIHWKRPEHGFQINYIVSGSN